MSRVPFRPMFNRSHAWYKITNNTSVTTDIMIYDEIGYWGITAQDFVSELKGITSQNISLHLNSPGGEVFDGIAIYQALKSHAANVTITVDSLAASIASVIAMAGDKVVMAKNAQMMIHDGQSMCAGNAADMRYMVEQLDRASNNIASIYADRAGKGTQHWRSLMEAETWFDAESAVESGLADEVQNLSVTGSIDWKAVSNSMRDGLNTPLGIDFGSVSKAMRDALGGM